MKIGVALTSVIILTGCLFYVIGGKWEKYPKSLCWAEITAQSLTEETTGDFVLVTREGHNREIVESEELGGEFELKKSDGKTVLSTPIFRPTDILPNNTKFFSISFRTNEGKIRKGRTTLECQK